MPGNYASYEDFKDIKKRFMLFSQIETIDVLQNEFLPKIARFAHDISRMEKNYKDNQICLR